MESEHGRMLQLLAQAQAGDEDAHRQVAVYCFEKYRYRLNKLGSIDPAISRDDLEMTFFEGCMRGVLVVDGRGNPLYHVGQRGIWNVLSELRSIALTLKQRRFIRAQDEYEGLGDFLENQTDPNEEDFREVVIDTVEARERVRVIAHAALSTANPGMRQRMSQALEAVLDGGLDPTEKGFNQLLAQQIGVSPQRASQIMAQLRREAAY